MANPKEATQILGKYLGREVVATRAPFGSKYLFYGYMDPDGKEPQGVPRNSGPGSAAEAPDRSPEPQNPQAPGFRV